MAFIRFYQDEERGVRSVYVHFANHISFGVGETIQTLKVFVYRNFVRVFSVSPYCFLRSRYGYHIEIQSFIVTNH
jgi:hypothetical protein